jgi:hypothetical protein
MLLASILCALFVVKVYFRRIGAAVRNFVSPKKGAETESDQEQAS